MVNSTPYPTCTCGTPNACVIHVPEHLKFRDARSPAETDGELMQLRRACYALTVALAKRILTEWNAENAAKGEPNNWPAQQTWDDLVGTSHSVLRRAAFRDAGLDEQAMVDLLFPHGYPAEGMVDDES